MRALRSALALCLVLCLAASSADARRHLHSLRAGSIPDGHRRLSGGEQDSVQTAAPFRAMPRVSGLNPAAITQSVGAGAGAAHFERRLQQQAPTPLPYEGGPVLAGTVNVYMTFMGYNETDDVPNWLENLVGSLSGHRWWSVMTRYYSNTTGVPQYMSPNVRLAGRCFWNELTPPVAMTDDNQVDVVNNIVTRVADDTTFPKRDPNGIYVVVAGLNSGLTPPPSFGANTPTGFCGWHSANQDGSVFAYIPDFSNTPGCLWPDIISPSGNPAVDAMASVLLHELAEAATDPYNNAWIDGQRQETGDKCNYQHGDVGITQYGPDNQDVNFNQMFGGRPYVVQQIWNPDIDPITNQQVGCVQGLDPTTATN